ncbi:MAG: winged helix-turn-helix transcriptional regulator [Methanomassiliicoccales archaeon]|nr:MAG: winged helix-turn-helix transcriptional regulator [Methanomassiliicoccales archaeon]
MMVKDLDPKELHNIIEITKLIHAEKSAVKILALTLNEPLSAQQIGERCGLTPIKCHKILRKLREIGLLKVLSNKIPEESSEAATFIYETQLTQGFVRFENGRFKLRIPIVLHLPNGNKIDVKALLGSYPDET